MLKYYVKTSEAVKRLRTDKDGVVSFEYVIVAACIVAVVAAAFGTGGASPDGADHRDHRDRHRSLRSMAPNSRGGIGMSQCPTSFEACI